MSEAGGLEQELPRAPGAPGEARRVLTQWYATRLDGDHLYKAKLLASELVTNAVLHGQGRIVLRSQLDADRLFIEVIDEGSGFEYVASRHDFKSIRGRGLAIVQSESSRWGIHNGTTHVWFELQLAGRDAATAEDAGPRLGRARKPAP